MKPIRVLIADDNQSIRKLLRGMLAAEDGYEICAEGINGAEAVALGREHRPDLVIIDFSMPVLNGLEAAERLKQILPGVRIVLFTAHGDAVQGTSDLPVDLVVSKTDLQLMKHIYALCPVSDIG